MERFVILGPEINKGRRDLYRMCECFVRSADELKQRGSISEEEYEELTRLKKKFMEENKDLAQK